MTWFRFPSKSIQKWNKDGLWGIPYISPGPGTARAIQIKILLGTQQEIEDFLFSLVQALFKLFVQKNEQSDSKILIYRYSLDASNIKLEDRTRNPFTHKS